MIRGFTEPSAQQAFFTFSSQSVRSGPLSKLFALWSVAQFGLIVGVVLLSSVLGFTPWIWPGQSVAQILPITVLDWLFFLAITLRQLGDSKGLTARPQVISAAVSVMTAVALVLLAAVGRLTFATFVGLNLVSSATVCVVLGYWLLVRHSDLCWTGSMTSGARMHLRRWWQYARPLIALEYDLPLTGFLSMYLIQALYGSTEQGYFALASRWSTLVLVFTGAALTIVWREIAAAIAGGRRDRAAEVYLRFSRLLVFIAVTLSLWLSFGSHSLVLAVAGEQYRPAIPIVALMAFYPVAQTYGQLSGAALKAAEQTIDYRNWSMLLSIPDVLLTYVLVAPATALVPGLGLGAMGVALKMAVYPLVSVQLFEWLALRFFGVSYGAELSRKLWMVGILLLCAVLTLRMLPDAFERYADQTPAAAMLISSVAYFLLIGSLVLRWPRLAGIARADLEGLRKMSASIFVTDRS